MEDYQNTEIGFLPNEWDFGRIDDYFSVQQGKQVSKSNRNGENQKPFLRTSNILWGKIVFDKLDHMHFSEQEEVKFQLEKNDLLVCEGGDIGRTAIWNNEVENCYYQNHLHRLRAKTDLIDPLFILHWLQYSFIYGNIYFGRGNITTIPNLSKSRLSELIIPQPELPEQRKIAHVLSTVRKAIEQQDKIIRTSTELKKALMQKLFTEGTRGEPQKETEIGLVPESWEVVKINEIFNIQQGKQVSKSNRVGDNQKSFLRTANIFWGKIDFNELDKMHFSINEETKFTLLKEDLLVCEGGDVGRTAICNNNLEGIYYQNHLHRLRAITDNIIPRYFMYWMMYFAQETSYVKDAGNRTTIPNLSKSRLGNLLMLLPNIQIQKEITDVFFSLDKKIAFQDKKKQTLTDLFKTLLHELMTGQRRVHELEFDGINIKVN
jgi:type I restriction enzyme S subunit